MANKKPRANADNIPVWCAHDAIVACIDLKPNPKNPNTHPAKQIALLSKIITKQGWRMPITVSNRSGLIVKGHGRLIAAFKAGISHAPIDYQDYETDDMEYADMIADNKLAELAEIDNKALDKLIKEMSVESLEFTALNEDELKNIFGGREPDAEKPEVEFSKELLLEHNYVVLYFDNAFDWQVAIDKFGLKDVKSGDPAEKCQKVGIGRVIKGSQWLDKIK